MNVDRPMIVSINKHEHHLLLPQHKIQLENLIDLRNGVPFLSVVFVSHLLPSSSPFFEALLYPLFSSLEAEFQQILCTMLSLHREGGPRSRASLHLPQGGAAQSSPSSSSVRVRFESMIRAAQDSVCEAVEGGPKFKEDVWSRPGGGGGISRVLEDGNVWEKAGVNVSVVYGVMPPEAYRAAKAAASDQKPGPIPFFAAGISSVLHLTNPFPPTLHFNYRYLETDPPKHSPGAPRQWWFGGGTDLTSSYIFEEDVRHFHSIQKQACDKFDPSFYPQFKKWCDDYFCIKHRDERRGLGGIFFDDLNDYDQEMLLAFATCNGHFLKDNPSFISFLLRVCMSWGLCRMCKLSRASVYTDSREKERHPFCRAAQGMAAAAKRKIRRIQLGI
ncbi:PREDICTED: coproporphyrinogen-III oxidase 2, chloroplastic-like [Tarenaya hassleriana]|uniref:coproporphyrinogen-III oxidase 2, chloroplastic-like n=1 Tax=Tarenaya hassleriana TaxID=28532 RepID=UPI0008FD6D6A|nr:PREDICTED: coproporphyrinogen-III oxidase 2, chloroplastic-like [Tarenaya hassleriana]